MWLCYGGCMADASPVLCSTINKTSLLLLSLPHPTTSAPPTVRPSPSLLTTVLIPP